MSACMFAVHYFFGRPEHLRNFARNVAGVLRPGGVFVGVCLDGQRVDALLSSEAPKVGDTVDGGGWRITRKYKGALDAKDPWKNVGREIDVFMETIGQTLPEFIVDYKLLVQVMAEVGLAPLPSAQTADAGLGELSTGLFDEAFARMSRGVSPRGDMVAMSDSDKRYSFMNRWFAFRKADAQPAPIRVKQPVR